MATGTRRRRWSWLRWFPWRYVIRQVARNRGLLDPVRILSRMESFAQEMATKILDQPELYDVEPMTGVLMFLSDHYDLDAACINNYFGAG